MYASTADMTERFARRELVELTDRTEPYTEDIVQAVMDRALEAATAEIEAALRERYALPLSPVPALVVDLCCDLARWRLWDEDALESVVERAKVARSQLRDLAAGKLTLDAAPAQPAATGGGAVQFDVGGNAFTRDQMGGW